MTTMANFTQILYKLVFNTYKKEDTLKEHHNTTSFIEEYIAFLHEHKIEFKG